MIESKAQQIKIVFAGDLAVGKTCLRDRFLEEKFKGNTKPTIGADVVFPKKMINNQECQIHLWDTAGQEKFDSFTKTYFRDANGVILVYDITRKHSLERVQFLYQTIQDESQNGCAIILFGNKVDLENERMIEVTEGEELAQSWNCSFFETSAKTGINVKEGFEKIFEESFEMQKKIGTKIQ
ncbi:ras and ef-hand domain-containing protein [Anaeramoeba ignava]|uniref:Ras and ef-hand domain-containing protein n=1 Tax=Anaeramoeba ignava TaxID=1746090 RepID=A0A9Q0LJT9_ANAIG|nr:ras and ef-hand domain-containing protein [Anaeramoeba ignava]